VTRDIPKLLVSDARGGVKVSGHLEAAGMKAGYFFRLHEADLIRIPSGSRLFTLPGRRAVAYDSKKGNFVTLPGGLIPVSVFIQPGFTVTYNSAYEETAEARTLPLFAYAAAVLYKGKLCAAAIRVDRSLRHDSRFIDMSRVRAGIRSFRKTFPKNRLLRHLEKCALRYGCAGAQNFFLKRYEAPLPVSARCNAACPACISYQTRQGCLPAQPRIRFIPHPEELSEIALFHFENVRDPIASFGQGCEGEPLLYGKVIEKAIRHIRRETSAGIINMNTNASNPSMLSKLFGAGLDSIRVSLNSARPLYYHRYYRPKGYSFVDVVRSVRIAKRKKRFVSLNYLTVPGFSDSRGEFTALKNFIENHHIDMIQWRNLNIDPLSYFRMIKLSCEPQEMLGIARIIKELPETFPRLMTGYYNPSRRRMKRAL
jgi:pyruvate-formate lyase-activating enzyme